MTKILLVEDDNNLREIYSVRLEAEGYEIITASDGEEALAVAVKEKPDLIVLDVMMPKISGFDVLDILRSTPETKNARIMMMTALSQDSDRERGEKLGADKYVVKSQVTLEEVVANVQELVGGQVASPDSIDTPVQTPITPTAAPLNVPNLPIQDATDDTATVQPVVVAEPETAQPSAPTVTPAAQPDVTQDDAMQTSPAIDPTQDQTQA